MRDPATAKVVLTNRTDPPDAILREVWNRSGGKRFERIEDVMPTAELEAILDRYKKVAGFDRETLRDAAELRLVVDPVSAVDGPGATFARRFVRIDGTPSLARLPHLSSGAR